jgi:hypothetical protein
MTRSPNRVPNSIKPALVQPEGAQAPLDVGLVVVGLGLGDAAQAVGVLGQQPQGRLVLPSGAAEGLGDLEKGHVVLTGPVVGLWWGEPEGPVERLQERQGDPALGGQLLVGAVQALGGGHHRRVQERQGQRPAVDQGQDGLDRQPGGGPGVQQPGPPHRSRTQPGRLRRQGARDQLPHETLGYIRPLGDLPDCIWHLGSNLLQLRSLSTTPSCSEHLALRGCPGSRRS